MKTARSVGVSAHPRGYPRSHGGGVHGIPYQRSQCFQYAVSLWRCIAQAFQHDEPAKSAMGFSTARDFEQHNYGTSGQATRLGSPLGHHNQFTAGAGYDGSDRDLHSVTATRVSQSRPHLHRGHAYADGITSVHGDGPFDTRARSGWPHPHGECVFDGYPFRPVSGPSYALRPLQSHHHRQS